MPDSQGQSWSDNPNTPKIPYNVYLWEKAWFGGNFASAVLYGMLVVLFSKCMTALFNPVYRRGKGIKWGLVFYTVIMFSLVTVHLATNLHVLSISSIDNRDFAGPVRGVEHDRGPYGYQVAVNFKAIRVVPRVAFRLNNWSADGLLLYRCYLFYSMNIWVIAFPFLMFLGSVATGILAIRPTEEWVKISPWGPIPYISISLSLNILLTSMIVVRLVLYSRNIRAATGSPAAFGGLYMAVATMLIESSALFAMSSLVVIGTSTSGSTAADAFTPILAETQVIASLLIIQRVANKSALTSNTIAPGSISSFKAKSRGELTGGSNTLSNVYPMSSMGKHGINSSGELVFGVETAINIRQDKV